MSGVSGVRVILNGEPRELADGETLERLMTSLGADAEGRGVAVALDGEVVPRSVWRATELREGVRIEVVAAVQGG